MNSSSGLYANIIARLLWGGTAYYVALSHQHDAFALFFQRLLWAFLFCLLICLATRSLPGIKACVNSRQRTVASVAAALVIACNWFTVFWCINHHQVIQASLGFFLAPMFTILLGVLVLREAFNPWSASALVFCLGGIGLIFFPGGSLVGWQAFFIAVTSSLYALLRKKFPVPPLAGNLFETGLALGVASSYALLAGPGVSPLGNGSDSMPYVIGIGVVTTVPMFFYVFSLGRISLSLNAYLQYISPTVMFLIGIVLLHEPMTVHKLLGFGLIWLSVAVYLAGGRLGPRPVLRTALVKEEIKA